MYEISNLGVGIRACLANLVQGTHTQSAVVEDCCCDYETVDHLNEEVLDPLLQELVKTPFFRYFKVCICLVVNYIILPVMKYCRIILYFVSLIPSKERAKVSRLMSFLNLNVLLLHSDFRYVRA